MSSHKQGFLRNISLSADTIRQGMNLWPPFVGAGIAASQLTLVKKADRLRVIKMAGESKEGHGA